MLTPYKHSKALGISVPLMLLGGISGAVILAAIYSAAIIYSPIAGAISFLFAFAFGIGIGYMNAWLGYLGKCRNTSIQDLLGVILQNADYRPKEESTVAQEIEAES